MSTELTASQHELIDWLTTPSEEREHGTSLKAYCSATGLSYSTARSWKKHPTFQEAWRKALEEKHLAPETQGLLMDRLLRIAASGSDRDAIAAITAYQKIVGGMAPEVTKVEFDPTKLSNEELAQLAENVTVLRAAQ